MPTKQLSILVLLLAGIASGCVSRQGYPLFGLQWPSLHPGTLDQQRTNAALHDPYPDPYAGPPNESSRPREFAKPLPEPVRNRMVKEANLNIQ